MASYKQAINWLAHNDDCYWLGDKNASGSVSAALVADLFKKDDETVKKDLVKELRIVSPDHGVLLELDYNN